MPAFVGRLGTRILHNPRGLLGGVCGTRSFSGSPAVRKTAIVTGSSRGIGRAIALRLAQDGYDICVSDTAANASASQEVVGEILAMRRKACTAAADVSDLPQVEEMIQASVRELGPLDAMVANAGTVQVKPLLDVTPEDFRRMFEVNTFGMHNCYLAAARQIISQGTAEPDRPAKLISAASAGAFRPFTMLSHYASSKWAVRGLNQGYALELAGHNITCNAYAPGIVDTPMWDLIDEGLGKKQGEDLGEVVRKGDMLKKHAKDRIALGRVSVPEDVSKLVSFLASRDSDYITGQCLLVDGGIITT